MKINVCDRCGKTYMSNENTLFINDGVSGCVVTSRIPDHLALELRYDLCDGCAEKLFDFLECEEKYSSHGRKEEDIWA